MKDIHSTAVVDPKAKISDNVKIGAHCVIGGNVSIGSGTVVGSHVVIEGWTEIGKNNAIYSGAVIGTQPQDLKFKGEKTRLCIGNDNIIREFVTINVGTKGGGGKTVLGDEIMLMAYCHVAHDCSIGNRVIMGNAATLGGHVVLEDAVIVSGFTGVHHYVRIGCMTILGGCSKVLVDVPPYCMADGHPARVCGLNVIGLRRNSVPLKTRNYLKQVYRLLYRSGLNVSQALERIQKEVPANREVRHLVGFIKKARQGKSGRALQPK